jgi:hypothetical protein
MSPLQYLRKRLLKENTKRWQKGPAPNSLKSKRVQIRKHQEEDDTYLFI